MRFVTEFTKEPTSWIYVGETNDFYHKSKLNEENNAHNLLLELGVNVHIHLVSYTIPKLNNIYLQINKNERASGIVTDEKLPQIAKESYKYMTIIGSTKKFKDLTTFEYEHLRQELLYLEYIPETGMFLEK